ncbi:right-handed parallel beta-helix repeat-containing protein [Candidatus Micrarchaeota archaeon]|nr:right-handed parallel beta-helix repeat-containing protein [Candidatus Micrarchaeota archaeon]
MLELRTLEKTVLLSAFFSLLFFISFSSAQVTNTLQVVGCNSTLTQNTTLYSNLFATQTCFVIDADNVTLDCAGYSITGRGVGSGVNATGRKNITIKNCNIRSFLVGINFTKTNNSLITNNTIFNSTYWGVYVDVSNNTNISYNNIHNASKTGSGISLRSVIGQTSIQGSYVAYNNISNSSSSGIYIFYAWNNTLAFNNFYSNRGHGVYVASGRDLYIYNNSFYNNTLDGVHLQTIGGSYTVWNMWVYNNSIFNNSKDGICLLDAFKSGITQNNIFNNSKIGINMTTAFDCNVSLNRVYNNSRSGVYSSGSNSTLFLNNSIEDNLQDAFYFSNSNHSTITNSSISGVPASYYAFNSASNSWNNTVLNTTFVRSKIYNDATSNLTVAWYARIHYTDRATGANINAGTATAVDAYGSQAFTGSTDASGLTAWFTVNDTTFGFSPRYYNNNSFTASKTGYGSSSASANVTYSQQIELSSGCGAISSSTTLTGNVEAAGSCFVFNADSITLDCAGYNITGDGNGAGVNATGRKNIVIKNCDIRNFTIGINFTKTNYSDVLNNRIWNISAYGIYLTVSNSSNFTSNTIYNMSSAGKGIYAWAFAYNNSFSFNNISNLSTGIYLLVDNNSISFNHLFQNTEGIHIQGGNENLVFSNNASNNSDTGIFIDTGSHWNTLSNNTASHNLDDGIALSASNNNVLSSNLVFNNSDDGFYFLSTSHNNSFSFNRVFNNSHYGAYISTSNYSFFLNDSFEDNLQDAFYFYKSNHSKITNCSISRVPASYYAFNSASNSWNNTILNTTFDYAKISNDATSNLTVAWYARVHAVDNSGSNIQNADVNVTDALGTRFHSSQTDASGLTAWTTVNDTIFGFSPVYYNNNSFSANKTGNGQITKSLNITSTQQVELVLPCGSLSSSTTLSTNVSSTTTCFNFAADSITLDCNGYGITGNGNGAGVNATGRKNIIIRNCNIRNFTVGINFTKTNYSDIANNVVWNNSLYDIFFTTSNSSNITSNRIYNGSLNGIYFVSSHNNTISSNNISNRSSSGIFATQSNNNTFSLNNVSYNTIGIYLLSSSNNSIHSNSVFNNSQEGISLWYCTNNSVYSNTVFNNTDHGIYLFSSPGNTIHHNTVFSQLLAPGSPRGIYIYTSHRNLVYSNNVSNNTFGIDVHQSNWVNVSSNNVSVLGYLGLSYSNHSYVHSNILSKSSSTGVNINDAYNNSIFSNNVSNRSYGIYVYGSFNNSFSFNRIVNNTLDAFYIQSSNGNNFTNESIGDNQRQSFYFANSNGSHITNSSISGVPSGNYALNSIEGSNNNIVLNTTFNRTKIYNDATSNITLQWFVRVHVSRGSASSLEGADVNVSNALGTRFSSSQTDSSGLTEWFVVNDTTFGFSPVYYNNNSFTANETSAGFATRSLNITSTQQIEFNFCGGPIWQDTTLLHNVSFSTTCFTITADSATLDCNGYSINGNGNGAGVNATGKVSITVKNCVIQNFTTGINFTSTNHSDVLNNTLYNNSLYGIFFTNSNSTNVSFNTAYNNSAYGAFLNSSINITLVNNTLLQNELANVFLSDSFSNKAFQNNSITRSRNGIFAFNSSLDITDGNIIENNSNYSLSSRSSTVIVNATRLGNSSLGKSLFAWQVRVFVNNSAGSVIQNANVNVTNVTLHKGSYNFSDYTALAQDFKTDSNGFTEYFYVYDNRTNNDSSITRFNNHSFYANKTNTGEANASLNITGTTDVNLTLLSTCGLSFNTTSIAFGSVYLGEASSEQAFRVTHAGSVLSNISIAGADWTSGGNSFSVSNTHYYNETGVSYAGKDVLSASNTLYYRNLAVREFFDTAIQLVIPSSQAVGSYTQSITITNACN